jgi:hypothetical protein
MDIWQSAKNIFIIDLVKSTDKDRYLFRYYGTSIVEFSGMELTGKYVDQAFMPNSMHETELSYAETLRTGVPQIWNRFLEFDGEVPRKNQFTRLIVPLLNKEEEPGHLLGVMHMQYQSSD